MSKEIKALLAHADETYGSEKFWRTREEQHAAKLLIKRLANVIKAANREH
jgi:hypothetical protein